jgi:hypothetical protein
MEIQIKKKLENEKENLHTKDTIKKIISDTKSNSYQTESSSRRVPIYMRKEMIRNIRGRAEENLRRKF